MSGLLEAAEALPRLCRRKGLPITVDRCAMTARATRRSRESHSAFLPFVAFVPYPPSEPFHAPTASLVLKTLPIMTRTPVDVED